MSSTPAYIFLDPDGTQGAGVVIVVQAPTKVFYGSQVGGLACEERTVEGFAVPNFKDDHLRHLMTFFRRYRGRPPYPGSRYERWTDPDLAELARIVAGVPLWRTGQGPDEPAFLALDLSRLDELTEGWIPVTTVYGPGILTHQNSD